MTKITKLSPPQIEAILTSGDFESLVSTIEHDLLECKREVYLLRESLGRIELAKDISALANSKGGYLLLGVHTVQNPLHKGDEITKVSCFRRDLCDLDAYRKLINERVYPSLTRHLRIEWHSSKTDLSLGIVAICIAPECQAEQPYLVGQVEAEGIVTGKLFGFYQRFDDDAEPMRIQELRDLLKKGMNSDIVLQKLEDIQTTLASRANDNATYRLPLTDQVVQGRVLDARIAAHLDQLPCLTLVAQPTQPVEFERLFESHTSKEASLIENPPQFRENGFDLKCSFERSEMVRAQLRRCTAHSRKTLELWKDGVVIFVACGDSEFLGWGLRGNDGPTLLINNYAFTEVVTLFVLSSIELFKLATPTPHELQVQLGLLSGPNKDKRYELGAHAVSRMLPITRGLSAPKDDGRFQIRFAFDKADVFADSFRLLSKVYNWFGFTDDQIPYQERGSNPRRVDRNCYPGN